MFKKVFYINLDRRPDRDENVKEQLKKINYSGPVDRIQAVEGRNLTRENISRDLFSDKAINDIFNGNQLYFQLTKGSAGCAMSHYNTYKKIIEELNDDEYALILEDDITIDDQFFTKLNNYLLSVPKFDILFLGWHDYREREPSNNIYGRPTKLWGLFGYIVNKKACQEIIKVYPLKLQIDSEMPQCFDKLDVFYLKEQLVRSDLSQKVDSKFGTDAQVREGFESIQKSDLYQNIILFILFLFIFYFL
jgi:glycosyl transferase family 25